MAASNLTCRASQVALGVKNLPANAGDKRDMGSTPGSERSPGVGNGNPLQYSCMENSMDRGAWSATLHGLAKSWTQLSDKHFHSFTSLSVRHRNLLLVTRLSQTKI